ncbi:MAG: hypothetical protein HY077_09555 [Elusimicrobia bacterium]|nr:hypothetical protein [Elusimicrobiota bacterium]
MGKDLLRLRRGVGLIYLLGGLIHACMMVYAALYSLGRLRVLIPAEIWKQFYFAHFLFLVLGSLVYLGLSFKQTGIFYYEVLADFLVGLTAFIVIMTGVALLLVSGRANPWWSLSMSGFLAAYGAGLMRGRVCGFGPKPPPLP